MPRYNFQKQFVPDIEAGIKTNTFRPDRKYRPRTTQFIHIYTGSRYKARRVAVFPIRKVYTAAIGFDFVRIGDHTTTHIAGLNEIAKGDGFKDWEAMRKWFYKTYKLVPGEAWWGIWISWIYTKCEGCNALETTDSHMCPVGLKHDSADVFFCNCCQACRLKCKEDVDWGFEDNPTECTGPYHKLIDK